MNKHPHSSYRCNDKILEPNPVGFRPKIQRKLNFYDFDGIEDFKTLKSHFTSSKAAANYATNPNKQCQKFKKPASMAQKQAKYFFTSANSDQTNTCKNS